ncbi:unnamed protein product [Allacma fusca]|uniref:Ionotropic glutamate receptor C-terminal domain-containing protein n=1 Tax=Allacma fusca TaxID=39272 RepID=A0A8J2KCI7_9HEXA|nr:unnamed protein product [Allacma fusca]
MIYRDLIMTPSRISYSISMQTFLMELNSPEKDESPADSVLMWRIHHVFKSTQLQKFIIRLPLTYEVIDCLVDASGKFQHVSMKTAGVSFASLNPSLLASRTVNDSFEFVGGFELDIINYLADALNFSTTHIRSKRYTKLLGNGSLIGIGEQVMTGEADIAISAHEYVPYRQSKFSFLHPTYSSPVNVYIVRKPASSFRDVFFSSGDYHIWVSLVAFWILSSIVTTSFSWLKQRTGIVSKNDKDVGRDSILVVTGAACQQGWYTSPDSVSIRIIVLASFITHIVYFAAFTATLVSLLSVDQELIRDSYDLTKHQYKMYSDGTAFPADYIANKIEGKSTNDLGLVRRTISSVDAFKKIYSEKAGLITFSDYFYPQMKTYLESRCNVENSEAKSQEKICKDIQQVSVSRVPSKAGMFLPKHSPLKPYFNQKIILLIERGIRHRFLTIFFRKSVVLCGNAAAETVPIEFKDVWTAVLILLTGYVFSGIIFLAEKFLF